MTALPPLFPFQENAVRRFLEQRALMIAHEVGMGKTRTALEVLCRVAAGNSDFRALIVTPANLRENFLENACRFSPALDVGIALNATELARHAVTVISYDFLRINVETLCSRRYDIIICDEIHHGKNRTTNNHIALILLRATIHRFLCLTGSPLQNSVDQFWALLELTSGRKMAHELDCCLSRLWDYRNASFLKRFFYRYILKRPLVGPISGIAKPGELRRLAGQWIDFASPDNELESGKYPKVVEQIIHARLSKPEWAAYQYAMRQIDTKTLNRAVDGVLSDRSLKKILWSLATARQTLLSPDAIREKTGEPTPSAKLATIAAEIVRQPLPALVFSDFLAFGAKPLYALLKHMGVNCALLHGSISERGRRETLAGFRSGGIDVLVLAPVGGEGLDLPGVRSIHLLEPHWNPEIIRQRIGRGRRIGSRWDRLAVLRYRAVGPNEESTLDDVIDAIARRKELVNTMLRDIIKGRIVGDEPILFGK